MEYFQWNFRLFFSLGDCKLLPPHMCTDAQIEWLILLQFYVLFILPLRRDLLPSIPLLPPHFYANIFLNSPLHSFHLFSASHLSSATNLISSRYQYPLWFNSCLYFSAAAKPTFILLWLQLPDVQSLLSAQIFCFLVMAESVLKYIWTVFKTLNPLV